MASLTCLDAPAFCERVFEVKTRRPLHTYQPTCLIRPMAVP